jgi:hypothetical protein
MTLAKVYLNHNAWFYGDPDVNYTDDVWYEKALAEVNEVLASPNYSLAQNYKDPFMADPSGCNEIIFALPLDIDFASACYLSNKCLHSASAPTFLLNSAPWDGSCAVPQFMDTYDADDQRKTDTWLFGQQYSYKKDGTPITIYQYNDYLEAGDTDGLVATEIKTDDGKLNYTVFVHSINNPGAYPFEGARFWKQEIVSGQDGTYGNDVCFYRLADAMFIKAECLLRSLQIWFLKYGRALSPTIRLKPYVPLPTWKGAAAMIMGFVKPNMLMVKISRYSLMKEEMTSSWAVCSMTWPGNL